jgi:hypothetical protein
MSPREMGFFLGVCRGRRLRILELDRRVVHEDVAG